MAIAKVKESLDFLDAFFGKKDMEFVSGNPLEVLCKITKIEKQEAMAYGQMRLCLVLHVKEESGELYTVNIPATKDDGTSKNLFYPLEMNMYNGEPKPAGILTDIKEAIRKHIGDEAYEARKVATNGITLDFFINVPFKAELYKGKDKNGGEFSTIRTESSAKINYWNYLVRQGNVQSYDDIKEYRDWRASIGQPVKATDNTELVEDNLADDLPF